MVIIHDYASVELIGLHLIFYCVTLLLIVKTTGIKAENTDQARKECLLILSRNNMPSVHHHRWNVSLPDYLKRIDKNLLSRAPGKGAFEAECNQSSQYV